MSISILKNVGETHHTYMCHNERQLRHASSNAIVIVTNVQMKHCRKTRGERLYYQNITTNVQNVRLSAECMTSA